MLPPQRKDDGTQPLEHGSDQPAEPRRTDTVIYLASLEVLTREPHFFPPWTVVLDVLLIAAQSGLISKHGTRLSL
jgi:hypothetical protein